MRFQKRTEYFAMQQRLLPTEGDSWLQRPLSRANAQPILDMRDPLMFGIRPAFVPIRHPEQCAINCVMMRGGTSKGLFFLARHLPADQMTRDRVLLAALGSPDRRQIDGLGGGDSLTSKVAILAPSRDKAADVDYLFAQVSVEQPIVDTSPSCGNILAGVATYAIDEGLVIPQPGGVTRVRIRAVNNRSLVEAIVQTPGRRVRYEGQTSIDGVPGTGAPIVLNFSQIVGAKTGKFLPTGSAIDCFDEIEVTCLDIAMPLIMIRASDLGKTGYESPAELSQDCRLIERIESIRRQAGKAMGLGDVSNQVIPKVALIAAPRYGGRISSRYFVPEKCHATHAVTGAICVASGCILEQSVARRYLGDSSRPSSEKQSETIAIEHPAGKITLQMVHCTRNDGSTEIISAGAVSTARRLFEGKLLVPGTVWQGPVSGGIKARLKP
jgi:4-oxalomesaconate tautomerase